MEKTNKDSFIAIIENVLKFSFLFLAIFWPRKIFLSNPFLHLLGFTSLLLFFYFKKSYNLFIYTFLSLFPYFLNFKDLTSTLNPVIYILLLIGFKLFYNKNDASIFLYSSLFLIILFIGEYILKFPIPLNYAEIYQNKLMLGGNISLQSKFFGNIHNILPFVLTVSTVATCVILKRENEILAFTSLGCCYLFSYIYLGRLCLYFMFILTCILIVNKITAYVKTYASYSSQKNILKYSFYFLLFLLITYTLTMVNYQADSYLFLPLKSFMSEFSVLLGSPNKLDSILFLPENIREKDVSSFGRLQALAAGIKILKDNFFWGIGPQQYHLYDPDFNSPHNFIVKIAAENGILGVVLVVFILFKTWQAPRDNLYRYPMIIFFLYSTFVGADLIIERLCINYALLTFLFIKICNPPQIYQRRQNPASCFTESFPEDLQGFVGNRQVNS